MKELVRILFISLIFSTGGLAQSIETAKVLYQQGDFLRTIQVLENVNTAEAILFTGKSYFALNNHLKAVGILKQISTAASPEIIQDASYTIALSYFELGNYAKALEVSRTLAMSTPGSAITRAGNDLYDNIVGFLSPKQQFEILKEVEVDEIRLDVLDYAMGKVDYPTALAMINFYRRTTLNPRSNRLNRLYTQISDSVIYWQNYNHNYLKTAPRGISYNIGVALPEFPFESAEYEIPQQLYFGIQLAIEQFNARNSSQRAFINYANTAEKEAHEIMADFVFNKDVDVVIGPMFSQVAKEFSELAERYEIPMILPLANSDTLDLYNNFVFQLNPTFAAQGKRMANFAVNVLGYDTLAVIAEARSLGASAARAFLHEAERNGAFVEYYFEENLEELGYDIRDYTKYFTTDTLDSVAMVKAVYAPFTGSIAPTLIESMLTDLEAMRSEVAILGSEEWQNVEIDSRRLDSTKLFFTRSFNVDTSLFRTSEFKNEFRIRFQTDPNQFAYIGYDAAQIVLRQLEFVKNPAYLREALKNEDDYKGLSIEVNFRGSHVNQKVDIIEMLRQADEETEGNPLMDKNRRRR
jgi:ABC-type branched-subunit amino acid transport system substrate-binding protein